MIRRPAFPGGERILPAAANFADLAWCIRVGISCVVFHPPTGYLVPSLFPFLFLVCNAANRMMCDAAASLPLPALVYCCCLAASSWPSNASFSSPVMDMEYGSMRKRAPIQLPRAKRVQWADQNTPYLSMLAQNAITRYARAQRGYMRTRMCAAHACTHASCTRRTLSFSSFLSSSFLSSPLRSRPSPHVEC